MPRLKKFLFGIVLLLSLSSSAQEVSQLHQFFSMNPMIQRDPLFQKVQDGISDRVANTELGFSENLTKPLLTRLRKEIKTISATISCATCDSLDISATLPQVISSDTLKFRIKVPVQINSNEANLQLLLDSIAYYIVDKTILEFLNQRLPNPALSSDPKGQLHLFVLGTFYEGLGAGSYHRSISYQELKLEILEILRKELLRHLGILKEELLSTIADRKTEDIIKIADKYLQNFLEAKKSQLIGLIDVLEGELEDLKENANKGLIGANTGISVSSDEGNLGGGIYAALKTDRTVSGFQMEIGAFLNGAGEVFQSSIGSDSVEVEVMDEDGQMIDMDTVLVDDNVNQPFLAGAALKIQVDPKFQINALMSFYILNKDQIDRRVSLEFGLGVQYNTNASLILGLSGFYQKLDRPILENGIETDVMASSIWSLGLTFQSTNPGAPTILVGLTKEDNNSDPLPAIQVSYPLRFN